MGEQKDLDVIEKAHEAAARIEAANKVKEEQIKRLEDVEKRMEGLRILGGDSYAGAPPPKELSEEEKVQIGMKNYFKGTSVEKAFR